MKTLETLKIKKVLTKGFVIVILFSTACNNGQKAPEMKKVAKPAIDLHAAAFMGDTKAIQAHIDAGSDLNRKDAYGSTPLITACLFGKTEAVRTLLDGGAAINLINAEGSTALHTAAFFCRKDIVKMLIESGADQTVRNKYGSTALESVAGPFDEVKPVYEQISKDLGPLGLKLDFAYLKNTRPEIAKMLNR